MVEVRVQGDQGLGASFEQFGAGVEAVPLVAEAGRTDEAVGQIVVDIHTVRVEFGGHLRRTVGEEVVAQARLQCRWPTFR